VRRQAAASACLALLVGAAAAIAGSGFSPPQGATTGGGVGAGSTVNLTAWAQAYGATDPTWGATNTWQALDFDAGDRELAITHDTSTTPEQFTFTLAGTYLISYTVAGTDDSGVAMAANYRATLDGTEIQGSSVQSADSSAAIDQCTSHTFVVTGVTAGQILRIQGCVTDTGWNHFYVSDANLQDPDQKVLHSVTIVRLGS